MNKRLLLASVFWVCASLTAAQSDEYPVMEIDPAFPTVNTLDFQMVAPRVYIPNETFTLRYPDLAQAQDTFVFLHCLRKSDIRQNNIVNVVLISLEQDTLLCYHIDRNNNRDFRDDGPPHVFEGEQNWAEFPIYDREAGKFLLSISKPEAQEAVPYQEMALFAQRREASLGWIDSDHEWAANFFLTYLNPSGRIQMRFAPQRVSDLYFSEYIGRVLSGMHLQTGLTISKKRLSLGLFAGIERLQYSSEIKFETRYNVGLDSIIRYNFPNSIDWLDKAFHWGALLEYDLPSRWHYLRLSPTLYFSQFHFLEDPVFDQAVGKPARDYFQSLHSIGYGFKLKILTHANWASYLQVTRSEVFFDASSYFENIDLETYQRHKHLWYVGFGTLYRLPFRDKERF